MNPFKIKPMSFWKSLLFFWVPSAYSWIVIYGMIPILIKAGITMYWSFIFAITSSTMLMLAAALIAYRMEGNPWNWAALKDRFRLRPIRGNAWLWTVLLIAMIPLYVLLRELISKRIALIPTIAPPAFLPSVMDPRVSQSSIPSIFMGIPLLHSWWLIPVQLGTLFFNIYGEELWWRGYILPRQELAFGRWTWLVHGLLWASFHSFWWWDVLAILPGALVVSFVAQRTRNTAPGIIWHWINNGLTVLVLLMGILGLKI